MKFGYLGTTDGAYDFNKTLEYFVKFKNFFHNSKIIIISKDNHSKIIQFLNKNNIKKDEYEIFNLDYTEIYKILINIDIGIFFLNNNDSIKASFPTKISEYFFCNKPILCNNFNIDIQETLNQKRGLIINDSTKIDLNLCNKLKKIVYENNKNEYCHNYAKENLTVDKVFSKIIKCYQSIK